ncbi:transcriptional regulator [Idiomarina tyrosinivorans]|uniref:Transcriptional regulator n=1 Tax=Idiomarina tyrosinivorans TaxID=1445662 RepID=A0A432ZM27_9GAMM|nr:AlpA family transcriptional regulator [Idiomarina tyrosinivorans]RUO78934.1 transcriptional regulator [Idiomarina tyrosinivorans]
MSYQLIKLQDVSKLTTLSRSSIYRLIKDGMFPAPVNLGYRSVAWVEREVIDWVESRLAERLAQ